MEIKQIASRWVVLKQTKPKAITYVGQIRACELACDDLELFDG